MVSGMQLLVDAALAHRTTDDILPDLVARVQGRARRGRGHDLPGRGRPARAAGFVGGSGGRVPEPMPFGEGFAGAVAAGRQAVLSEDPSADVEDPALRDFELGSLIGMPLLAEEQVTGVLVVCTAGAAPLHGRGRGPAAAGRRPRGAGHRPRPRLRARAPHRRDASAEPPPRPSAAASRADRGGALPARRVGGRGGRRLVRRDPHARRPGGHGDGRRGGQGPGRRLDGGPAAKRAACLRARGTRSRRPRSSSSTGCSGRRPETARWPRCCTPIVDPGENADPLGQRRAHAAAAGGGRRFAPSSSTARAPCRWACFRSRPSRRPRRR